MITGFTATVEADDAGTGAAPGGLSTKFDGVTTFNLPGLEAPTFDATVLDQPDNYEQELPTGVVKMGKVKGEMAYTKANRQRLEKLCGVRGYTIKLTTPDDLTTPGTPVKLVVTLTGFVNKVDETKFEKGNPALIPFEITIQKKFAAA